MQHPKTPSIAAPVSSYSPVVIASPGRLAFISGQLGVDSQGTPVGQGDVAAQARQIFRNLEAICADLGVGLDRIVKLNYYIADASLFGAVRQVREQILKPPYPAATAVVASPLGGFLLEVEAVVELGGE